MAADSAGGAIDRLHTAGTGNDFRRKRSFHNGNTGVRADSPQEDGDRNRSNSGSRNYTDPDADSATNSDPVSVSDTESNPDSVSDPRFF